MDEGVDDGLAQGHDWKFPNFAVTDGLDFERVPGVALRKLQRLFHREHWKVGDAGGINNQAFVFAFETTGAQISFGKVFQTIHTKQQHAAHRGNFAALMLGGELKRVQFVPRQFADWCEALGSHSEVNRFRVQFRHGFFIKGTSAHHALKFGDCGGIGLTVRRADADIDTGWKNQRLDVMRPARAGLDFNGQHILLPPRNDVNLRDEPWLDPVGNEICELFLRFRRVRHAENFARAIFDTDEQSPARAIRKSNQRAHYLVRRGKVAFEFQSFSLMLANDFSEVEHTQKSTRKRTDVASFRAGVFADQIARSVRLLLRLGLRGG